MILWTIRPDHVAIADRDGYPCTADDVAVVGTMTTLTIRLLGRTARNPTSAPPSLSLRNQAIRA